MIPSAFEYYAPTTLAEAFSLLNEHAENAKVLAGGHSLLPMMRLRMIEPQVLVDINGISGLSGIEESGGGVPKLDCHPASASRRSRSACCSADVPTGSGE